MDEHIHSEVIDALRQRDVPVVRFIEVFPLGTDDRAHLDHATGHSYLIVTGDVDFFRHQEERWDLGDDAAGVVFVTPSRRKDVKLQIRE